MTRCVVEAHNLEFDSYRWLNILDHLVLVVASVVNTLRFGSLCRVGKAQPWKVPQLSKKKKKKKKGLGILALSKLAMFGILNYSIKP